MIRKVLWSASVTAADKGEMKVLIRFRESEDIRLFDMYSNTVYKIQQQLDFLGKQPPMNNL